MNAPQMAPYGKHIFVCTGRHCSPPGKGKELYQCLPYLLAQNELLFGKDRTKRGETSCLGVCQDGPIVAVYPEGIWYHHVTPELLEKIVTQHLRDNQPITEHVFHTLSRSTASEDT